jgi:hypothetical protein
MLGSIVLRRAAVAWCILAAFGSDLDGLLFAQETLSTTTSPAAARRGHAHNDYLHLRPLLDALEQGFGSVEADVFLVDGELLVAHTQSELSQDRTLKRLYLEPLSQRIQQHGGSVYGGGQPLTLLIDVKSDGTATFQALHRLLLEYRTMLAYVENDKVHPGPVRAIVSGNRAIDAIAATSPRLVGIDGRLTDLDSKLPDHLLPLISDNWQVHFDWRGVGEVPVADRQKLRKVVAQAHRHGRMVRFWAIPDKPAAWQLMNEAGVDLINTDDLPGLSHFLENENTSP